MGKARSATVSGVSPKFNIPENDPSLSRFGGFDNLEQQFQNRPSQERLIEQNILKRKLFIISFTLPKILALGSLAPQAEQLEKSFIEVKLNQKFSNRPSEKELMEQNILKAQSNIAISLVGKAEELKKHQLQDTISKSLLHRPSEKELKEKCLLTEVDNEE
ncbi:hypothetical protein HDU92_007471 [Lobulomyces angularis]|nr:hypothetical protein HDU92_007471 [Lobulomyces angularis]